MGRKIMEGKILDRICKIRGNVECPIYVFKLALPNPPFSPGGCYDCGKDAKFAVIEKNGEAWLYCGVCEVG